MCELRYVVYRDLIYGAKYYYSNEFIAGTTETAVCCTCICLLCIVFVLGFVYPVVLIDCMIRNRCVDGSVMSLSQSHPLFSVLSPNFTESDIAAGWVSVSIERLYGRFVND